MGKIIALGGGEIGRPGYPIETTAGKTDPDCYLSQLQPMIQKTILMLFTGISVRSSDVKSILCAW